MGNPEAAGGYPQNAGILVVLVTSDMYHDRGPEYLSQSTTGSVDLPEGVPNLCEADSVRLCMPLGC